MLSNIKHIKTHKDYLYGLDTTKVNNPFKWIDEAIYMLPRTKNILDAKCFVCNSSVDVEIHHLKKLSNIKLNNYLISRQVKMNRKQIPLCKSCHIKHHTGKSINFKLGPGI